MRTSTVTPGTSARIARIVAAKWAAPPSGSSSRFTEVTTACATPSVFTASATCRGSSGSSGRPIPCVTAQKPQCRVQTSPMSMNVAVRSTPQHSARFGQRASWQTVLRRLSSTSRRTSDSDPAAGTRTFSQSGLGVTP